jgi:MFS family permease
MREPIALLRESHKARVYFLALAQSSLGTGAAVVALLLVAYERFSSPWAIGLVLLAEVAPAMFLGPVFGAAADRYSRRLCIVVSDILRAGAFIGIFLVDGFVPTLALALIGGIGTGMFTPAGLAALPSISGKDRLPAATSLYGAVIDFGFIAGPGIAAVLLLVLEPDVILAANGVTFAISAIMLMPLGFGEVEPGEGGDAERPSLLRDAREGLVATAGMRGLRLVLVVSAAALFCGALFTVGELLLAKDVLDGGEAGFSLLVTIYGVGFIGGSLSGSKGGSLPQLKRRFLMGSFLMAAGFVSSGVAPLLAAAAVTFLAAGYGNGLLLVYERLLIQEIVPDKLSGRVFGVKDALASWAFALGFLAGPVLLDVLGVRATVVTAGAIGLLGWAVSVIGLRGRWSDVAEPELEEAVAGPPPPALFTRPGPDAVPADTGAGEQRPYLVGR